MVDEAKYKQDVTEDMIQGCIAESEERKNADAGSRRCGCWVFVFKVC